MAAEEEFEIYLRTRKRYERGSDGFIERQHVIFAGFLDVGRLIKEPGVLRYLKFVKIVSRNRNVRCLFLLLHGWSADQLTLRPIWNKEDIDYCYSSHRAFSFYLTLNSDWAWVVSGTLIKYGDVHKKLNYLKRRVRLQDRWPLNTFWDDLAELPLDECALNLRKGN